MSRAAKQDIQGSVLVPIMLDTAHAYPTSLIQSRTPCRAGDHATYVAGLGGESFIHFLERSAMPNGLVRKHRSEGCPRCVTDAFRHLGLGESRGRDVADRDVVKAANDIQRRLVQMVLASASDSGVDVSYLPFFPSALRRCKSLRVPGEMARVGDHFAIAQGSEGFESKVNANPRLDRPSWGLGNFYANVQKPIAASVARKTGVVLNFRAGRQISALENFEIAPAKSEAFGQFLDVAPLERNPPKGFLAAPAQIWPVVLSSALGVLHADRANRTRVQANFLRAAESQFIEIKARRPFLAPLQCMLLGLVAKVPHTIHRAGLPIKQSAKRLNAVAVNDVHLSRFKYWSMARRTCSATDSPVLSASNRRASIVASGRNKCVRFMHTMIAQFGLLRFRPG